jgi:hypothetical protein
VAIQFKVPTHPEAHLYAALLQSRHAADQATTDWSVGESTLDLAALDRGKCVIVRIFSFVSGSLIHQERVTDPDLPNKVRKVLQSWSAKPFGMNGSSISNC